MRQARGFTIIQIMIMVGIAGIALSFAVEKYLDVRCKEVPGKAMCKSRTAER